MSMIHDATFQGGMDAAGNINLNITYKVIGNDSTISLSVSPDDLFGVSPSTLKVNPARTSVSTRINVSKKKPHSFQLCTIKCAMPDPTSPDNESCAYATVETSEQPTVLQLRTDRDLTLSFRGQMLGAPSGLRDLKLDELLRLASGPPLQPAEDLAAAKKAAKKAARRAPDKTPPATAKTTAKSTAKTTVKKAPAKATAPAKPTKAAGSTGKPVAKKAGGKRGAKT